MKKLIYGSLFIAMVGIVLFSCKKQEVIQSNSTNRYKSADFEFIGIEHNKLLDETFNYLSDNINSLTSLKEVNEFLSTKTVSYPLSSKESNDYGLKLMTEIFSNTLEYEESLDSKKYLESFSGEQLKFLKELDEILSTQSSSTEQLISNIEKLENQIDLSKSITNDELIVLYSATTTAKYSLSYWDENYSRWKELGQNLAKAGPGDNIAKGDAAGAIGGASGAAAVNVIPGAGQVAYGGAIIGGAVAGSVGVAVNEFFNWLGW